MKLKLIVEVPVGNAQDVHALMKHVDLIRRGPFNGRVTAETAAKRIRSMSPKELRVFLRAVDDLTRRLSIPLQNSRLVGDST